MTSQTIQTRSQMKKSSTSETGINQLQKLSLEVQTLKKKNEKLHQQLSCLRGKKDTCLPKENKLSSLTLGNIDLWMKDDHIKQVFKSYSALVSQTRKDIIFVEPNVTQVLKSTSLYDSLQVLSPLDFDQVNLAFFALSNYNQCNDDTLFKNKKPMSCQQTIYKGAHWSLLIFHRSSQTFYHVDSIKGANSTQARLVAKNVNCDFKFREIKTVQQVSNFECGLHVLMNTKYILDHFLDQNSIPLVELLRIFKDDPPGCKTKIEGKVVSSPSADRSFHDVKEEDTNSKCTLNTFNDFSQTLRNDSISNELNSTFSNESFQDSSLTHKSNGETLWNKVGKKSKQTSKSQLPNIKCINRFTPLSSKGNDDLKIVAAMDMNCTQKNTLNSIMNKSSTLTKSKFHVKILSDSHGRNVRNILADKLDGNCMTSCSMKPNGKVSQVLSDIDHDTKEMVKDDYIVIVAGTNDITPHLNNKFIAQEIKNKIQNCSHTNIIVTAIPYRYDKYSFFNKKINRSNNSIRKVCDEFKHSHYLPLHSFCRNDYATHGLHLNTFGKQKFSNLIIDKIDEITRLNKNSLNISTHITQRKYFLDKALTRQTVQDTYLF